MRRYFSVVFTVLVMLILGPASLAQVMPTPAAPGTPICTIGAGPAQLGVSCGTAADGRMVVVTDGATQYDCGAVGGGSYTVPIVHDGASWACVHVAPTGPDGHVIEDDGTPRPNRPNLNFTGAGVSVADVGGDTTEVTISSGGGHTIENQGTPVSPTSSTLNFTGAGVLASDVGGKTTVAISGAGFTPDPDPGQDHGSFDAEVTANTTVAANTAHAAAEPAAEIATHAAIAGAHHTAAASAGSASDIQVSDGAGGFVGGRGTLAADSTLTVDGSGAATLVLPNAGDTASATVGSFVSADRDCEVGNNGIGCVGIGYAGGANSVDDAPVVLLRYDDARDSQYSNVAPALLAHKLHATFFVNSTNIVNGTVPTNMTEAELIEVCTLNPYVRVSSHSALDGTPNGNDFDTMATDNFRPDINWIYTNCGYYPKTYAPPGHSVQGFKKKTDGTPTWLADAADSYNLYWHRMYFPLQTHGSTYLSSAAGIQTNSRPDASNIACMYPNANDYADNTGAQITEFIRQALVEAGPTTSICLAFHDVDDGLPAIGENYPEAEHEALLTGLSQLQDAGLIRVMSFHDYSVRLQRLNQRQYLDNPGFGHHGYAGDPAELVSGFSMHADFNASCANDTGMPASSSRYCDLDLPASTRSTLGWNPQGLVPGKTYYWALEVEQLVESTPTDSNLELWVYQGGTAVKCGYQVQATNGDASMLGKRQLLQCLFNPVQEVVYLAVRMQSFGTGVAGLWRFSGQVFFELGEHIIKQSNRFMYRPDSALSRAGPRTTATDLVVASGATGCKEIPFQRDGFGVYTKEGMAPTDMLATMVVITTSVGTGQFDWWLDGHADGGGTDYYRENLVISDAYTWRGAQHWRDEEHLNFVDFGSDMGGDWNVCVKNNHASQAEYTIETEGFILQ